jgi:hypothetical protein
MTPIQINVALRGRTRLAALLQQLQQEAGQRAAPHLETRPSRRLEGSFSGLCFSSTNISGLVSNCKS